MSVPGQSGPPRNQPGEGSGCALLAIVLIVMAVAGVVLGALCGGFFYVVARRSQVAFIPVPPAILPSLAPAPPQFPINDWMTDRVLAPVYATALDAVTTNKMVTERLGEPIGAATSDDSALYRRKPSDNADSNDQIIEFDIEGPKGKAAVSVQAIPAVDAAPPGGAPPGGWSDFRLGKITVKFSDGSSVDVPPPSNQPAFVPIR